VQHSIAFGRSLKYGLIGALLAGAVGGTVAWSNDDHVVHLVIDGRARTVTTDASTVGGVLRAAGYTPRSRDIVAPATSSAVHDGSRIVLRRARQLHLDVDGRTTTVWTTAPTVAAALAQLGYSSADVISVSRSSRLPLTPTDLAVSTPKAVTVIHDGQRQAITTTASTVDELLDDLDLTVHRADRLSVPTSARVRAGETIRLVRIENKVVTRARRVAPSVRRINDAHLDAGRRVVVRPGAAGLQRDSWVAVYIDGKLSERGKATTTTVRPARTRVVRVGTRVPSPAADATPAQLQAYARSLLPSYGWGEDQMSCLITMWNHESSWNPHAENPSSGAYGIPQALPGDKMGPGWNTDAGVQIRWGLSYIKDRYNSPCQAWSFWQQGSWY
jgi:uncharacterized protein YabE (DUF348 family)